MKRLSMPPRPRVASPVWVLALATALVLAAFGLAFRHRVDAALHDTYQHRLARLLTLQHRLNEQVLRAHAGLVGSYDPIVRTMRELRDVHRELSVVPAFVSSEGRGETVARLERSRAVLAAQEDLVERFKSQNAILLNSLRYFPVAASELAAEMANEPEADREAAQLREALRDVLRVAVFPTDEAIAETTAHLASIEPSGPHAAAVRLLLRHARVITVERPAVDALLGDILEQPGESAALELGEAYEGGYRSALSRAEATLMLFLASILIGILAVATSIVLRMRADAQVIAEASKRLATSIDRQNRFVSMTSHEFRTPLSVIVSSADLLTAYGEKWGSEQHKKHLGRIERAGRAMTDLLDGMLLIGRTDAGHRDFRPGRVDVAALAHEVVETQRARAKEGVKVELELDEPCEAVRADPRLLRHALDNLVANAVKYSRPAGVVKVRVAVRDGALRCTVEDEGIGIPMADQEKLFDTFHRARNVGQIQGTGLGLAIIKRAVELHGGTVGVKSQENVGTCFDIVIPVGALGDRVEDTGEMAAPAAPQPEGTEGTKV